MTPGDGGVRNTMNELMSAIYDRRLDEARAASDKHPDWLLQRTPNGEVPFEVAKALSYIDIAVTLLRRMPQDVPVDYGNLLDQLMGDLSDHFACAGWLREIEFILWCLVSGDDLPVTDHYGFSKLNQEDLADLRFLSERGHCWPMWVSDRGHVVLVGLTEWTALYRQWYESHQRR